MSNLNYGVVGNCRTAALISEKGSIDWLCFPDFDSPSIFASLLDRERGGSFGFDVTEDYHISQSYVPHTNILSTSFLRKRENLSYLITCLITVPAKMPIIFRQNCIDM